MGLARRTFASHQACTLSSGDCAMASIKACVAGGFIAGTLSVQALPAPLSPIPKGDIAIDLQTVASGLGAPDYAISPPGDPSRLFVLDQKGLVRVIQNGNLLSTPALDLQ